MKYLVVVLIALIALAGCSVLSTVADNKNQLAVQYATASVIERTDVDAPRVAELAAKAKSYVGEADSVLISQLVDEGRALLDGSDLLYADKLLIEAILQNAQDRLEARLGGGILTGEQRVQLLTILEWIEDTANGYQKVYP